MRHHLHITLLSLLLILPGTANSNLINGEQVVQMTWDELMPEDYTLSLEDLFGDFDLNTLDLLDDFSPEADKMLDNMMSVLASAPIVPELDQKMVRIPGFVVPLEYSEDTVSRFFLVPYFGACIHVPPPPSNQIIDIHFEPGTRVESLYDAVWISGLLTTETFSHDMGTAGYRIEAYMIEPYEYGDEDMLVE
ncbi:DUF3299 domain-containing protein [Nitrincola alkalilacustris]|uniref:DUF3299 domain-containing protein n=1 Tax=Nitrincola alkalilacustris TaxID=1571224 RepID=UPI00124F66BE|nr:DUF3299 domain-containing protein [Nitrincola alkalilacustris]